MATILFTGFPGFLGSALLPRVLARHEGDEAVCLVQAKFARLADARRSEIERDHPQTAGRIQPAPMPTAVDRRSVDLNRLDATDRDCLIEPEHQQREVDRRVLIDLRNWQQRNWAGRQLAEPDKYLNR